MLSASYTDPRLAAAYDALNPEAPDTAFYVGIAGSGPQAILDVGCGTGLLTCRLAACGHIVTGADPSAAMLDIARRRPGGTRVEWLQADAAGIRSETRFDLAVMTGHAFQALLTDRQVGAALDTIRGLMKPGGRLAFETRNPVLQPWTGWTPRASRRDLNIDEWGCLTVHHALGSVAGDLVHFDTHYRFGADDAIVAHNTLRFMSKAAVETALVDARFTPHRWYGDWDRSPWRSDSREIIVVAHRDGVIGTAASGV